MAENVKLTILNGDGLVLGRLASHAAKLLLSGETVVIINSEKVIITGSVSDIKTSKKDSMSIRGHGTPWRGPFHYRTPDAMIRRTVRGMLPWKTSRGREAYKRLDVYIGKPIQFEGQDYLPLPNARLANQYRPHMTVGDLAKELSWRK